MSKFKIAVPVTLGAMFKVASDSPGRFALHGVQLKAGPDGVVATATDGKILLQATYAKVGLGEDDGAAVLEGEGSTVIGPDVAAFLATAGKALYKPKRMGAVVELEVDGEVLRLSCALTGHAQTLRPLEGSFPDTSSVIPSRTSWVGESPEKAGPMPKACGIVVLNDTTLPPLMLAMAALAPDKYCALPMRFSMPNKGGPIRLDAERCGVRMVGVVMPMDCSPDQPKAT